MTTNRIIDVYGTSILTSAKIRSEHEKVQRILTSARIPFNFHDVSSDEALKAEFKRRCAGVPVLPLITSGGERVGSPGELEEAAEFGELRQFLKLDVPPMSDPDAALLSDLTTSDAAALAAELDAPSAKPKPENPPEPVPTPACGADLMGLPKDEMSKKEEQEKASIPTVPSGAQIAASLEGNPGPTASSGA